MLAGHDHTYERIERDGITYIVNGLGGRGIYDIGEPIEGSIARYNEAYGALFMDATTTNLSGAFLNINGDVIDSFAVQQSVSGDDSPD